jgi:Sulfotransferase family
VVILQKIERADSNCNHLALEFETTCNNDALVMRAPTTAEQTRAPIPIRALNKLGAALECVGIKSRPAKAEQLIEKAKNQCGLEDFGDGEFFEPLSRLLEACEREAKLNVIGKMALRGDVVRILSNRLMLARDRKIYPEIAQQEIREPLFIVGLPRSGTTLLHILLAADPAHRAPLTWEVMSPSPPTEEDREQRIRQAARNLAMLRWLAPTFESVHATGAALPQECVSLMSPTFMSDQFDTMYNVPSYRAWFFAQDLRPAYEFHRRSLQHFQFRKSGERWVLKAPAHMFAAPTLLATYPDARFVQIHRDPIEAVASVSSLVTILRRIFSDDVDPIQIGRDAMSYWAQALKTFLHARDQMASQRVCDLYYKDVRRDPIAAARAVYEHFGWKFSHEIQERMAIALAEQNSQSNGAHRYDAAYFRLQGMNGFADYCERFGFSSPARKQDRTEAAA